MRASSSVITPATAGPTSAISQRQLSAGQGSGSPGPFFLYWRSVVIGSYKVPRAEAPVHRLQNLQAGEYAENLIQKIHELLAERAGIEQSGDRAQQVAEQVARALHCGDIEHHLI